MFWISFLIHIPLLLFLAFFFAGKWNNQPLKDYYFYGLSAKIVAGILLGLVYLVIYNGEGDTYFFFDISLRLNNFLYTEPVGYLKYLFLNEPSLDIFFNEFLLESRILAFVKVICLINIFTFSNYWVTGMYLSFFSFLGMYHLSNSIIRIFRIPSLPVLIAFLFFPSVLFWSSGLMKESLLMGALGFAVSFFLLWIYGLKKPDAKGILFCLICLLAILALKFYYFAALMPAMISCIVTQRLCRLPALSNLSWFLPFILVLIFVLTTALTAVLHPILHPSVFMESLLRNYEATLLLSQGKNVFYFPELTGDWLSLLSQFPKAVFIGLFRPLPGDVNSAVGYMSALENIVILAFAVITIIYLVIKKPVVENSIMLTTAGLYIIILSFILPIASPNWGSLIRYKIGYLPFLLLLVTFRNPLILYLDKKFLKGKEAFDSVLK